MQSDETPTKVVVGRSHRFNWSRDDGCAFIESAAVVLEDGKPIGSIGVTSSDFLLQPLQIPHWGQITCWAMRRAGKSARIGVFLAEKIFDDLDLEYWGEVLPNVPYVRANGGKILQRYIRGIFKVEFHLDSFHLAEDGLVQTVSILAIPSEIASDRTRRRNPR